MSTGTIDGASIAAATQGLPAELRRVLETMAATQDTLLQSVGITSPSQQAAGVRLSEPQRTKFEVSGVDGRFIVRITNPQDISPSTVAQLQRKIDAKPNPLRAVIYHQIQSSTDETFADPTLISTYGGENGSEQLNYDITDPNQTKFWRRRSRVGNGQWGPWRWFTVEASCGPTAVTSGQLRSTSIVPGSQLNTTNFAVVDGINDGTGNITIRVYGEAGGVGTEWTRQVGTTVEGPFPAAELDGYELHKVYFVYFDDSDNSFAVLEDINYLDSLPDNMRFVGKIVTENPAGTSATAHCELDGIPGSVSAIIIDSPGSGYTSAPEVTLTGGDGGGAEAGFATISGGQLISITLNSGGFGYTTPPSVNISGGFDGVFGGGGSGGLAQGWTPYAWAKD